MEYLFRKNKIKHFILERDNGKMTNLMEKVPITSSQNQTKKRNPLSSGEKAHGL